MRLTPYDFNFIHSVVIMFLVCQLPTASILIYKIFYTPTEDEEALLRGLGNIFNFLVGFNAACNFLLYCALSDKYRKTFVLTLCPCYYRPHPHTTDYDEHQRFRGGVRYSLPSSAASVRNKSRPNSSRPMEPSPNHLAPPNSKNNFNGLSISIQLKK